MTSRTELYQNDFPSKALLNWYTVNKRELPWRDSGNPYHIWISEVMLQQTQVDTVIPYFNRFIESFPTLDAFASSDRQQVLKHWEGLGYYSRARNFHHAAKTVIKEYDGQIPDTYDSIIKLKGVGPYTAAAVLSIAFGKPHAVTDGNVYRVLARYFGIEDDIRSQKVRNDIGDLADVILDKTNPGDFNQALMELGALICRPARPDCDSCPLSAQCVAYKTASTHRLPYKSPGKKVPHHHIGVGLIIDDKNRLLIALRPDNVMLGGLWEFPGGKKKENESLRETVARELKEELGVDVAVLQRFKTLNHAYSHFKITLHAYLCRILEGEPKPVSSQEIRWVEIEELEEYPFPKANKVLTEKLIRDGITI